MPSHLSIYTSKLFFIFSLCVLLLYQSTAFSARLYKWIDEDGQIRYSDSLPAAQSTKRHQTLTPDGRVLQTMEAAIPAEQLASERAEKKQLEKEARLKTEQIEHQKSIVDHHDNVLLMTFSNESEILEAQNERAAVIDSVINLLRKNIKHEQIKLDRLEQRADEAYIKEGLTVPGGLAQNIEYFAEKILGIKRQIGVKLIEREKVKQQYALDLLRFRELTQSQKN